MDLSNKALAMLLVAAIIVSVGGTMLSVGRFNSLPTGRATDTDTGTVTLEITSNVTIQFDPNTVDWGSGYVTSGSTCELNTTGSNSAGCNNFNVVSTPFSILNLGNENVSLKITSDVNASDFIGGVGAVFQMFMTENSTNTETACSANQVSSYTDITTEDTYICGTGSTDTKFNYGAGKNVVDLDIGVTVPDDAPAAVKTATLTATGDSGA